jgi:hypothetical protein
MSSYHEYLLHTGQKTQKRKNIMTCPGSKENFERGLFIFHLLSMSNDKEGEYGK